LKRVTANAAPPAAATIFAVGLQRQGVPANRESFDAAGAEFRVETAIGQQAHKPHVVTGVLVGDNLREPRRDYDLPIRLQDRVPGDHIEVG
jgi:hypothetical protein